MQAQCSILRQCVLQKASPLFATRGGGGVSTLFYRNDMISTGYVQEGRRRKTNVGEARSTPLSKNATRHGLRGAANFQYVRPSRRHQMSGWRAYKPGPASASYFFAWRALRRSAFGVG